MTDARDRYLDALLDSVDARRELADRYSRDLAEDMRDELARIVAVAARAKVTPEQIAAAIARERLDRLEALALLELVRDADELAGRIVRAQARAVVADRRERAIGPVTADALEARRAEREATRTDSVRMDADPVRLLVGGRVPAIEKLSRMTDAELNLLLKRFGIGRDRDRLLSEQVRRASMRLVGADRPSDALVDAVLDRAEAAVRRTLRQAAKDVVRQYERARLVDDEAMPMRWVSVLRRPCPDCVGRHNTVRPARDWDGDEPGTGNTVCGLECECELKPDRWFTAPSAAAVAESVDEDLAA